MYLVSCLHRSSRPGNSRSVHEGEPSSSPVTERHHFPQITILLVRKDHKARCVLSHLGNSKNKKAMLLGRSLFLEAFLFYESILSPFLSSYPCNEKQVTNLLPCATTKADSSFCPMTCCADSDLAAHSLVRFQLLSIVRSSVLWSPMPTWEHCSVSVTWVLVPHSERLLLTTSVRETSV